MKRLSPFLAILLVGIATTARAQNIPEPLRPWVDWVLWNQDERNCPVPFNDPKRPICLWPGELGLAVDANGGSFTFTAQAFAETWIPLPGSTDAWPLDVRLNGTPAVVVTHEGAPSVKVPPGLHKVEGAFRWNELPQQIQVPPAIGILTLTIDGTPVPAPVWEPSGALWLRRDAGTGESARDFLSVKIYSLLEDGIPLWLQTEIELIVSGKSREEFPGAILPTGWRLASVESPLPTLIDENGQLRVQVRPGRWVIRTTAFRTDDPRTLEFPKNPAVADLLIGLRARPDFRFIDLTGATPVDVSQTTYPDGWRNVPVFRWDLSQPIQIEERLRGPGEQNASPLNISRQWWLEESGRQITFRDQITGTRQQIWRLDAAPGQDLGSVRSGSEGLLVTKNPATGAPGVEIRTTNLDLTATGRIDASAQLPASGWQADAGALEVTLNLPPGWRLFALSGADWVHGDWLTAWNLLDLFLLLVFTLAVWRLWGIPAGLLAFAAFALSYQEAEAPRFIWLALLIPLAILRVLPPGRLRWLVGAWKWLTVAILILILAPFLSAQVQQALYPQLEKLEFPEFQRSSNFEGAQEVAEDAVAMPAPMTAGAADVSEYRGRWSKGVAPGQQANSNLLFDAKARIQTGPGVPDWTWRVVRFGWNGPVPAGQQVTPILIPMNVERILTVLRIVLVLALAAVLLGVRRSFPRTPAATTPALLALALFFPAGASAQFPDKALLDQLRDRLLEKSDAFPHAAEIPQATLTVRGSELTMTLTVNCAASVAVPLPGGLNAWSPLTITTDGKVRPAVRRTDGFLWIALPPGVHQVTIRGQLPPVTEWEWSYLLKPRHLTVDAPEWNVTGVRPNGVPENQVFFSLKQRTASGEATYDRQDLTSLVAVERRLELGLVWQLRTTVTRLTPPGRAVSVEIPLLPGENVLTGTLNVQDGKMAVRLGANEPSFSWESELSPVNTLTLTTNKSDTWVERWRLVASPVWNVTFSGIAPVFETDSTELIPTWHPWPGESVEWTVTRPEAVGGATVTIDSVRRTIRLGQRQRQTTLTLQVRASLGEDFRITLPPDSTVTSLQNNGQSLPVRLDEGRVIIPIQPGESNIVAEWTEDMPLGLTASATPLSLPVESANITTTIDVPQDRWILTTHGPLRGPAVRFWIVLVCSVVAAWALSRVKLSPLGVFSWILLALGLTQVPLVAALLVAGWLFFLAWRGTPSFHALRPLWFNVLQVALVLLTVASLAIFVAVVGEGLLGRPEMFILGNNSTTSSLNWYSAQSGPDLPQPGFVSVSIWWYRLLMLAWALWLALALIRWLTWAWKQFSSPTILKRPTPTPPPIPSGPTA